MYLSNNILLLLLLFIVPFLRKCNSFIHFAFVACMPARLLAHHRRWLLFCCFHFVNRLCRRKRHDYWENVHKHAYNSYGYLIFYNFIRIIARKNDSILLNFNKLIGKMRDWNLIFIFSFSFCRSRFASMCNATIYLYEELLKDNWKLISLRKNLMNNFIFSHSLIPNARKCFLIYAFSNAL